MQDYLKAIHDHGMPAGLGTHIPEVIAYAEEHGWETDFYMACFYNLARTYKAAPMVDKWQAEKELYPDGDPARMTAMIRQTQKPCLGFKILAANRRCATQDGVKAAFDYAFRHIKPTDGVVVGMFPKYTNQVEQNVRYTREALGEVAARVP